MWWVLWSLAVFGPMSPGEEEAAPWLGRYASGPEKIGFRWDAGLVYDHGKIAIPVDGEWHETVPEFIVRHRVRFVAERGVLILEESHDASEPWRYEFRLDEDRRRIQKFSISDDGETLVRTFERVDSPGGR